jgi:hypothetical protein
MKTQFTKAIDGYRWLLSTQQPQIGPYAGLTFHVAFAQQRCTTDTGRVYFRYVGMDAKFDTVEERARFLANYSAKAWAGTAQTDYEEAR